jgi:hypothetical protein
MFAVEIGGGATANVTPHYAAIKLARAVISCCRPQSCGSPTFTYVCDPTRRTHDMLFSARCRCRAAHIAASTGRFGLLFRLPLFVPEAERIQGREYMYRIASLRVTS